MAGRNGVSKQTTDMLDSMMKKSNLPLSEQRRLKGMATTGGTVASAQPRRRAPPGTAQPALAYEDPLRGIALNPRLLSFNARRNGQQIAAATNGYQRDMFRGGGPAVDSARRTECLQNLMTYGEHAPDRHAPKRAPAPPPTLQGEAERLHEQVSAEIRERQEFLEEMRRMGRGAEHEQAIGEQVSERLGELKQLEAMMRA